MTESVVPVNNYSDGDIVWVKLGSSWWPGVVKDPNSAPKVNFKKPPIAVVSFFEEETFEYVKEENRICPYNCEQKEDFIKRGLTASRTKIPNPEKFKSDIIAAEIKINGNPNILSEPHFLPEKRVSYVAEVFGPPSNKKKTSKIKRKKQNSFSKNSEKEHITHRRFLGYDDFEVHYCIQFPGKDRQPASDDEEVIQLNKEDDEEFQCSLCKFVTTRLEVLSLHHLEHLSGTTPPSNKKRTSVKKPRKERPSNKIIDLDTSSEETEKSPPKRKQKLQGSATKSNKQKKIKEDEHDIRGKLLAEWDDKLENENVDDPEKATQKRKQQRKSGGKAIKQKKLDIRGELLAEWEDEDSNETADSVKLDETVKHTTAEEELEPKSLETEEEKNMENVIEKVEPAKSCFDFDEKDDEYTSAIGSTAIGRKIPRVIPDKRKSKELDDCNETTSDNIITSDNVDNITTGSLIDNETTRGLPDEERDQILKVSESFNSSEVSNDKNSTATDDLNSTFNELMETTVVPTVPEVTTNTLKCEQNFHCAKTIKFPDKPDKPEPAESPTIATKLTNPKKRFVKSFEDFEQYMNEQRRMDETIVQKEEKDQEESLPCPTLKKMEETKKKAELSMKEVQEPLEQTTEDINKELQQEVPQSSAAEELDKLEAPSSPSKSQKSVEISILKNRIMSKINEESPVPSKMRKLGLPRTHGSRKILESSTNNQKSPDKELEIKRDEKSSTNPIQIVRKEKFPPKKSVWSFNKTRYSAAKVESSEDQPYAVKKFFPSKQGPRPPTQSQSLILNKSTEDLKATDQFSRRVTRSLAKDDEKKVGNQLEEEEQKTVEKDVKSRISKVVEKQELPRCEEIRNVIKETVKSQIAEEIIKDFMDDEISEVIEGEEEIKSTSTEPPFFENETSMKKLVIKEGKEVNFPLKDVLEEPLPKVTEQEVNVSIIDTLEDSPPKVQEEVIVPTIDILEQSPPKEVKEDDNAPIKDVLEEPPPKVDEEEVSAVVKGVLEEGSPIVLEVNTSKKYDLEEPSLIEEEVNAPIKDIFQDPLAKVEEEASAPIKYVLEKLSPKAEEQEKMEVKSPIKDAEAKVIEEKEMKSPTKNTEVKVEEKKDVKSPIKDAEPKLDEEVVKSPIKDIDAKVEEQIVKPPIQDIETKVGEEKCVALSTKDTTEKAVEEEKDNEIVFQCANQDVNDDCNIAIKTNLTNLTKVEEMSALALATLSDVKTADGNSPNVSSEVSSENSEIIKKIPPVNESELVPIEGNLTIMSEKDLADGQVEITASSTTSLVKKPVSLMNFSMDFSETPTTTSSSTDHATKNRSLNKKIKIDPKKTMSTNIYERLELLDILQGTEKMGKSVKQIVKAPLPPPPPPPTQPYKKDELDFDDMIPSQFIPNSRKEAQDFNDAIQTEIKTIISKQKFVKDNNRTINKPIILSEKIIKPSGGIVKNMLKRTRRELDDSDSVLNKATKKIVLEDQEGMKSSNIAGKAKILQQTIITPAGEIIQPTISHQQNDDNVFDINSMPIVLSDEILTPESIENMPIVLGNDNTSSTTVSTTSNEKVVISSNTTRKIVSTSRILNRQLGSHSPGLKTVQHTITKSRPKILQTSGNVVIKPNSPIVQNSKPTGKYIIVSQTPGGAGVTKKYIGKKSVIIKKPEQKLQHITPEPSGNKIMIVTNQQGQQQRLLLTPSQQKMLGYQNQSSNIKQVMKSNLISKNIVTAGTSGMTPKNSNTVVTQTQKVGQNSSQTLLTSSGSKTTSHQIRTIRTTPMAKKVLINQSTKPPSQKTIVIKNQLGQTVRKFQGSDEALLEQQVAAQLEAIKANSIGKVQKQKQEILNYKNISKTTLRRSYPKKSTIILDKTSQKIQMEPSKSARQPSSVPPLAPLSPEKVKEEVVSTIESTSPPTETKPTDRPLKQLVIQDAMGNQTTITEGQILALPSETVDGQPQSYMLVTLDETGNLTPLNNEALMSLDPNLVAGGDFSNMVLQIDQGTTSNTSECDSEREKQPDVPVTPEIETSTPEVIEEKAVLTQEPVTEEIVVPTTSAETGQQLIVTGDPIATQKFLESLTEGTTDLSNILANTEGSIIIQADGQQILINTNSDNQMLLSVNNDNLDGGETSEGGGNPMFATQPNKFQDILAAALADTDFQQEQSASNSQNKLQSQLSPNNTLYPMNVGNVLETSLTLNSPIMTPLEVPSTNNKKINDESDILTQVPKNVDLPITITDPNISQTVSQQQVALMASELQTNLELSLPISESAMSVTSVEMNSPSYVYSLPTLDDGVDMNQKSFNSSMPLLTEDVEETIVTTPSDTVPEVIEESIVEETKSVLPPEPTESYEIPLDDLKNDNIENNKEEFNEDEEGLCTLGGEMCSSLSEPPPDMFDIPGGFVQTENANSNDSSTNNILNEENIETVNEDSCEIPIQPQIVANLSSADEPPELIEEKLQNNCVDGKDGSSTTTTEKKDVL